MTSIPQNPPKPAIVEIVIFPDFQLLDLAGPLQVIESANAWARESGLPVPYATRVVARTSPVRSWAGLGVDAAPLTSSAAPIDTLIVSGGDGVRAAMDDAALLEWIAQRATQARRFASVCTGAFLLGRCGLIDGRRVVTHWQACDLLAKAVPSACVERDPIYIEDGQLWTSAGVTAGIDMTLALVERDLGHRAAMAVARRLVMFLKRPGGQSQFSAALRLQTGDARLERLHGWMADNLDQDLSVAALARQASMSERSFVRHYRRITGTTPARAVEAMRVEAARELLTTTVLPIKRIARHCGFGSEETMRRSFLRHVGVAPQEYRQRFGTLVVGGPSPSSSTPSRWH